MTRGMSRHRSYSVRDLGAWWGLLLVLGIVVGALSAEWLTAFDPHQQNLLEAFTLPNQMHWLGTDHLGRDIWSRLLFGARNTLGAALFVLGVVLVVATTIGLLAGYVGGWVDSLLMRLADLFLAFPTLLLAIAVAGTLGPGLRNVTLALALVWWAGYARLIRSVVLRVRHEAYIEATRACGAGNGRIVLRHILPNVIGPVIVVASLDFGAVILSIAGLNFLGLGVQPPHPEWGAMLNDARPFLQTEPYLLVAPALAIILTVLGFNLLGDALRDWLDPHHRERNPDVTKH